MQCRALFRINVVINAGNFITLCCHLLSNIRNRVSIMSSTEMTVAKHPRPDLFVILSRESKQKEVCEKESQDMKKD
jgi:hypothetical protein